MSTKRSMKMHPDYLKLLRRHPLRTVRTDRDHDAAMKLIAELAVRAESALSSGERDYLDALAVLLEDFDRRRAAPPSGLTGLDLLRHLMEANGLKVSDLGRIIGSQPNASLILSGRRQMSKAAIRKLADRFGVDPGMFLRDKKSKSAA